MRRGAEFRGNEWMLCELNHRKIRCFGVFVDKKLPVVCRKKVDSIEKHAMIF